jgi:hypothetical protein
MNGCTAPPHACRAGALQLMRLLAKAFNQPSVGPHIGIAARHCIRENPGQVENLLRCS